MKPVAKKTPPPVPVFVSVPLQPATGRPFPSKAVDNVVTPTPPNPHSTLHPAGHTSNAHSQPSAQMHSATHQHGSNNNNSSSSGSIHVSVPSPSPSPSPTPTVAATVIPTKMTIIWSDPKHSNNDSLIKAVWDSFDKQAQSESEKKALGPAPESLLGCSRSRSGCIIGFIVIIILLLKRYAVSSSL